MNENLKPQKFAVARCGVGALGLILCNEPQEVIYDDGNRGMAWTGIQLQHTTLTLNDGRKVVVKPGDPWSSKNPEVCGLLEDFHISITPIDSMETE